VDLPIDSMVDLPQIGKAICHVISSSRRCQATVNKGSCLEGRLHRCGRYSICILICFYNDEWNRLVHVGTNQRMNHESFDEQDWSLIDLDHP